MPTFSISDRARKHARELLKKDAHAHLRGIRIRYDESDADAPGSSGCGQLGKVKKLSDWEQHLTGDGNQEQGDQVAVTLLKETWGLLDGRGQQSALDHLFGHITKDGEKVVIDQGHDVEVNLNELDRTGLWSHQLKRLKERIQQLPLDAEPIVVEGTFSTSDSESDEEDYGADLPHVTVEMLDRGGETHRALVAGIRAPGIRCNDCGSENVHPLKWQEVAGGNMYSGYVCRSCGVTFTLMLPEGRDDEDEQEQNHIDQQAARDAVANGDAGNYLNAAQGDQPFPDEHDGEPVLPRVALPGEPHAWSNTGLSDADADDPDSGPAGPCVSCSQDTGWEIVLDDYNGYTGQWSCASCGWIVEKHFARAIPLGTSSDTPVEEVKPKRAHRRTRPLPTTEPVDATV